MHQWDEDARSPNLATTKFNFLAWAARNENGRKLSGSDLMVLVQLVVRNDPTRNFAMSVPTLAHRTGLSEASVRLALTRLKHFRLIESESRPGRSSFYKVAYLNAPPNWIKESRDEHNLSKRGAAHPPRNAARNLRGRPAKALQGSPPKSCKAPPEEFSAVSISSNHSMSHRDLNIRPRGHAWNDSELEEEETHEEKRSADLDPLGNKRMQSVTRALGSNRAHDDNEDEFGRFVKAYPKQDNDPDKLKRAWSTRVIKAGIDPKEVIAGALALRRKRQSNPATFVPFPGRWLAEEGWKQTQRRPTEDDDG